MLSLRSSSGAAGAVGGEGDHLGDYLEFRKVWQFSAIFCCVFIAYGTTEILQSSLYQTSGYVCLFTVYACFLTSSITGPFLVNALGISRVLWTGALVYMATVLVEALGPLLPSWCRLLMCALVGCAGGGFWSAQGLWLSLVSQELARARGTTLSSAMSSLNSRFYIVFSTAQVLSQLLASAFLFGFGPGEQGAAVSALFAVLTVLAGCGTLGLAWQAAPEAPQLFVASCCAPPAPVEAAASGGQGPPPQQQQQQQPPTPLQVLRFFFSEPPLLASSLLLFYRGGSAGFVLGPFLGAFSSSRIGVLAVGFVAATYNLTCMLAALPVHRLVQKSWCGRRWVLAAACCAHLTWLIGASVGIRTSASAEAGSAAGYATVFCAIALFAVPAPVFQAQIPALLQTWYTTPQESTQAIAAMQVVFSLGFCAAQGLGIGSVPVEVQCAVWAGVLAVGSLPLLWLHSSGRRAVE